MSFKTITIALVATGLISAAVHADESDSSLAAFEAALTAAEARYGPADSTVDLKFYKEGIPYRLYYRSYQEAAELYQEYLSSAETAFGADHPVVSDILLKQSVVYIALGKYADAESAASRALSIRTNLFGDYHAETAKALDQLGMACFYNGKYSEALTYCDSSLTMLDSLLGSDHPQVAWSSLHLARVIIPLGYYDDAESLSRRALAIVEPRFGSDSPEMADCLEMVGLPLYCRGERVVAESLYVKALDIHGRYLDPNHPEMATLYFRLANDYRYLDRYEESESLFVKALQVRERTYGRDHPEVAEVLHYMGYFYRNQKIDLDKVLYSFSQALRIREKTLDQYHPDIAETVYRLGQLYKAIYKPEEAERCLRRALALRERIYGMQHRRYYDVLEELAGLYSDQGRYAESLPLAEKRADLAKRLYGPVSDANAAAIDLVAYIYYRLGKFDVAETYFKQSLSISEALHGSIHPRVAEFLADLAINYENQGRYYGADTLLRRAVSILRDSTVTMDSALYTNVLHNHGMLLASWEKYDEAIPLLMQTIDMYDRHGLSPGPALPYALSNLGLAFEGQGRFAEADSVLRRSIELGEVVLGPRNVGVGHALNNLANLSSRLGRYAEAESLQVRAISILEGSLGVEHPEVAKFRRDMGKIYACSGKSTQSLNAYEKFIDHSQRFLENVFPYSSEQQKLRWMDKYPLFDYTLFSLALSKGDADARRFALEMLLKSKAMVIEAVMAEKQAAYCHYDDATLKQLDQLNNVLSQIAELSMAGGYYRDSVQTLYSMKDSLEVTISRHCSEFSDALAARRFEVNDISKAIEPGAVLWEFMRYVPCNLDRDVLGDEKLGPERYLAFTIDHVGKITITDVGEASIIDSLILSARDILYKAQGQIYSVAAVSSETRLNEVTGRLYEMIFAPLAATSKDKNEIYIAPDGLLNLIPFEILSAPDGSYVIENYHISYLSSGRDLMKSAPTTLVMGDVFVLADPDFDRVGDSTETKAIISDDLYGPEMRGTTDCLNKKFNPLPYSRGEASKVIDCFRSSKTKAITTCYGTRAAEERLKQLTIPPRVVHLATHGFFCETTDTSSELRDNPLLRSGLALAGANRTIGGERGKDEKTEDGILTALEVSGLNLVGTELAVLSACESGVGDLVNGEGVFGLRRAFQHAGAQTVIISLWPIPDRETSQLMDGFYHRWLEGMSKRDALRQSAIAVLNESRQNRGCGHPLLWGGFILTGNPN